MIRLLVPDFTQCIRYKCANRLAQTNKSQTHVVRQSIRKYAQKVDCPPPEPKGASGTKVTLGLLTLGAAATIGYAKYDEDFRKWLTSNVPYTDETIRFIFQEDKSFLDYGSDVFKSAVAGISNLTDMVLTPKEPAPKKVQASKVAVETTKPIDPSLTCPPPLPEIPPPPERTKKVREGRTAGEVALIDCTDIEPLPKERVKRSEKLQQPIDRPRNYRATFIISHDMEEIKVQPKFDEIRSIFQESHHNEPQIVTMADDDTNARLDKFNPKNLGELESMIRNQINKAVNDINQAIKVLREYNQIIEEVVVTSADKKDDALWQKLKKKTIEKDEVMEKANRDWEEALKNATALKTLLKEPRIMGHVKDESRHAAEKRLKRLDAEIDEAKQALEAETKLGDVTEQYWNKVLEARKYFVEEFRTLLPDVNINDQHLKIEKSPELDLFLTQIRNRLLYYQTELTKMETLHVARIKNAIEEAQRKGDVKGLEAEQIETGATYDLAVLKRNLQEEYEVKQMQLSKEMDDDLKLKLKQQACIMQDLMKENLANQENELKKIYSRELNDKLSKQKFEYKERLAAQVGKIKAIDETLKATEEVGKDSLRIQKLWQCCQALVRSLSSLCPGTPHEKQMRPLANEICAIQQIVDSDDELVQTVLSTIPLEALERGVYSEEVLRERFLTVEKVARNLALIPANGAPLIMYFWSYLQNLLLIKNANPIPQAELDNEPVDFSQLDTYDILQRARYWLDRGNFAQTLKYMNLLQGASRCIAKDWMKEVRITLETKQAANVLMAHAVSQGLQYM